MIPAFISGAPLHLFFAGLLLNLLAGTWLLFVGYSCDADLARRSYFRPWRSWKLVILYPKQCLAPFLLQQVAVLLCLPLFLHLLNLFSAIAAGEPLDRFGF